MENGVPLTHVKNRGVRMSVLLGDASRYQSVGL